MFYAVEQLWSLSSRARELRLLKPVHPRDCSATRGAATIRRLRTATGEEPPPAETRDEPAWQ